MKYRKKPVVIEAWPVSDLLHAAARDWNALPQCIRDAYEAQARGSGVVFTPEAIHIWTLEGEMRAERGDMVIRGVKGEFYPCKPDIFAATYEPATEKETS